MRVRKAVERFYTDSCTVIEQKDVIDKKTKITEQNDVEVLINQPCKLSYSSIQANTSSNGASGMIQVIKLFLAPEIEIKPGSKIVVTREGKATNYKSSGFPAIFKSHQEIVLELFDRWA